MNMAMVLIGSDCIVIVITIDLKENFNRKLSEYQLTRRRLKIKRAVTYYSMINQLAL